MSLVGSHRLCSGPRSIHHWRAQLPSGCLVAMEVISTAPDWACRLRALGLAPSIAAAHMAAPYRLQGKSAQWPLRVWQVAHTVPGGYIDVSRKSTIYRVMVETSRQNRISQSGMEVALGYCEWPGVLEHARRSDLKEFEFD